MTDPELHPDGSPGQRAYRERRYQQTTVAILEVIDIHPALTGIDRSRYGCDLR